MKTFDRFLEYFLATLMALMLLSVCWQVLTRYVFTSPSSFTDELARYLLIWIGTLGAAYASGKRLHLAIDLFPSSLQGKSKYRLSVFLNVLIILFAFAVLVVGGSRLVYITYTLGQVSAAMQLPLAYVYTILPISGLLIVYYKIRDIMLMSTENPDLNSQNNPS
ncbi:TRAP transporter small permease [Gracilimonas sp.]|uniref:TRAP transporter small permease n=1 Tax=Gracilimonas sp. TaxID=1974203 RepID=UPI003BABBA34